MRIHDTSGEEWTRLACPPRHLCHYGDAFLLTYDITSEESFTQVKRIKAEIEKELNKASNVYICVAAMKTDLEAQVADLPQFCPEFFFVGHVFKTRYFFIFS